LLWAGYQHRAELQAKRGRNQTFAPHRAPFSTTQRSGGPGRGASQ
jgi:hypothetical protein